MNERWERHHGAEFAGLPGSLERPREAEPDDVLAPLGGAARRPPSRRANGSHVGVEEAWLERRTVIRLGGNGF